MAIAIAFELERDMASCDEPVSKRGGKHGGLKFKSRGVCEYEAAAMRQKLDVDVADGAAMRMTTNAMPQKELDFPKLLQRHLAFYHGCSRSGHYVKSSGMPESSVLMMLIKTAVKAMLMAEDGSE